MQVNPYVAQLMDRASSAKYLDWKAEKDSESVQKEVKIKINGEIARSIFLRGEEVSDKQAVNYFSGLSRADLHLDFDWLSKNSDIQFTWEEGEFVYKLEEKKDKDKKTSWYSETKR